jgi:cell division protease FtsH
LYFFRIFNPATTQTEKISYTAFKERIEAGKIDRISMKGNEIRGDYKEPVKEKTDPEKSQEAHSVVYKHFRTVKPSLQDPDLLKVLEENDVTIVAESEERSWLWVLIVNLLPWLLIIGFFVYTSKRFQERMGGKAGGIFGFGKSKAKLYTKSNTDVTFEDVAGLANTKKELLEVVEFLKDPAKFQDLGGELPKGILLVGPPGVGKTLMAKAVAGEADVPFYSISGSEFIEMFVGVGASRVRDMFKRAKKEAPAIIFIDELDSIGGCAEPGSEVDTTNANRP